MKRGSGVLMHVSSLWGDHSEGSFGKQAKEWIDFIASMGFSYWQVLPFCLPDGYNSPYKSFSAFSVNPFFIDLDDLYEKGLLTKDELDSAIQKTPYTCEFAKLHKERLALLAKAAERFDGKDELDRFFASHPGTEKFCLFMALRASNGNKPWDEWTVTVPDADTLRTWHFTQYMFFRQWKGIKDYANQKGVSIIGDIPIYVDWNSSDVWADPDLFLLDERHRPSLVAGVPPDYFCADGQLWGNPLYDWERMEKDGFSWWKERISFMTELFDGVRIDHFRAFESYYAIDASEKTARSGKWVKGPGMKLINAVKSVTDKLLIAEDLGDITEDVVKLVNDSGFPGMRIMQFAFLGDESSPHLPHNYVNNCIAYTGTHDNNTLLGYVWEASPEERRRMFDYCGYDSDDIHHCYDHILRTLFASSAGLVILPVQDLLLYGSDTRLNHPGECDGNWEYRLTKDQLKNINTEKFKKWNRIYGR